MFLPTALIDREFIDYAKTMLRQTVLGSAEIETQNTAKTQRNTYNFGYNYRRLQKGDRSQTPIPGFLFNLCQKALCGLKRSAGIKLPDASLYTNCIVSVYGPGFKLQPHIDVNQELATKRGMDFYFDDNIIGVVLQADRHGSLYLQDHHGKSWPVREENGTAFLLSGPTRHCPHGVNEVAVERLSATFRIVHLTVSREGPG